MKLTNSSRIFIYFLQALLLYFIFNNLYYGLTVICLLEVFKQIKNNNFISTYTFWQLGYLMIVCIAGVLTKDEIILKTDIANYSSTSFVFFYSQLIIVFYYRRFELKTTSSRFEGFSVNLADKFKPTTLLIIVLLYVFFLYSEFPNAYNSFFNSRFDIGKASEFGGLEGANRSLLQSFMYYLSSFSGYVLPSLIFVWFNKKYKPVLSFIFTVFPSAIIWAIYFIIGTRHNILFSFMGLVGTFSLINSNKIKFRTSFLILILLGYFFSIKLVEIRKHGLYNYLTGNKIEKYAKINSNYSADKTILYMNYVYDYYEENKLRYGKSTLEMLFFWVPRKLWNNKPPQFGYWFIRDYLGGQKGFGNKFSAPSSYLGVPYSDYGKLGVILISLLIAWLSNKLDVYFRKNNNIRSYKQVVILSFCLASFFFLPRQLNQFFSKFIVIFLILQAIFFINSLKIKRESFLDNLQS